MAAWWRCWVPGRAGGTAGGVCASKAVWLKSRPLADYVKGWKKGKRSPASSNEVCGLSWGTQKGGGHLASLSARAEGKNHG